VRSAGPAAGLPDREDELAGGAGDERAKRVCGVRQREGAPDLDAERAGGGLGGEA